MQRVIGWYDEHLKQGIGTRDEEHAMTATRGAQMTPRERVLAALAGHDVDHPPVSLWQHFPERDQSAAALGRIDALVARAA